MTDRILEPHSTSTETALESTLRPRRLAEFVGQKQALAGLKIALLAAQKRHSPLDHLLLYGPPGLGKTTLAYIISAELGGNLHLTSGPALTRAGDLASLLTNLEEGDVLFIDEIHRLGSSVEETLYSAMEEFRLDIILGKGPSARSVSLELKPFTLVGATTKYGALSSPLRSRFGMVHKLDFYTAPDLESIIARSAKVLGVTIQPSALTALAARSRGIPRIANRLLKRARDLSEIRFDGIISSNSLTETFKLLKLDDLGLDDSDREVLSTIIRFHKGGPVGVQTIAATLSEDTETIEEVYEPFLMSAGLLARTKQGRVVTDLAYSHLGFKKP